MIFQTFNLQVQLSYHLVVNIKCLYSYFLFPNINIKKNFDLFKTKYISTIVLVLVDHFVWFNYFTKFYFPFDEIVCFFVICVWAVPFEFFISLSANDNTLPYGNIINIYILNCYEANI